MPTTVDLQYELPTELIAQHPVRRRTQSQLMVVEEGSTGPYSVGTFDGTLLDQLDSDDLIVANDTRVRAARIPVTRPGGGGGEILLVEPRSDSPDEDVWRAMARPARRLRPGMMVSCVRGSGDELRCVRRDDDGHWFVKLPVPVAMVDGWLADVGEIPLPPYITPDGQDPARYQTVHAVHNGSVAAPTAGLHFDEALWEQVVQHREVAHVTLHVGPGTFLPIRDGDVASHVMHSERYVVPAATDASVRRALNEGRRVVAVGTTTTRVLESVYGPSGMPLRGSTDLFIQPGYEFGCVGAMVTNFHLPDSTLLALVMSRAGVDTVRRAYDAAIERRMRFYSFGDAMFIAGNGIERGAHR